jgi:hypothetical protein
MAQRLACYRCGATLEKLTPPLARLDACPRCGVDMHVCRMCEFYNPRLPTSCAQEDAPEVGDKQKANFCDFFVPSPNAFDPSDLRAAQDSEARVRALFADEPAPAPGPDRGPPSDPALEAAEELFKK